MIEEGADERGVEHLDLQFRRCDAGGLPREVEQQPKAVPIGGDRVRARMSLRTQTLDEEGFKGGRERGHDPKKNALSRGSHPQAPHPVDTIHTTRCSRSSKPCDYADWFAATHPL